MDLSVMVVFDIIVIVLGLYLIVLSIGAIKNGKVPAVIVPYQDMLRCTDEQQMSKYLMPRVIIFSVICVICGAQGILNDTEVLVQPKIVNTIFMIAFLIGWGWFSYEIKKSRDRYLH